MSPLPGRDRHAVFHAARPGRSRASDQVVAVVGGGIAGLAAATALVERGVRVVLWEREQHLGGRVGGWPTTLSDGSEVSMNRGFHAFFRQYYNLRGLLRRTDPLLSRLTPMLDYPLVHSDGYRDTFQSLPKTPPLNAFAFALNSPTFTLRDITRLSARAALPLVDVRVPETYEKLDDLNAAEFLERLRFPAAARHLAFEVFSRSFFAAPTELSAAELATMFHLYFLGSSEGLVFDVAADSFATLWNPLGGYIRARGAEIRLGAAVETIEVGGSRRFVVDGLEVDGVVLAADVTGLRGLVDRSPGLGDAIWRARVEGLRSAPPFLVSRFWLDRPVRADRPGFLGTSGYGSLDNISVLDRYERESTSWATRTGGSVVELHGYALTTVDDARAKLLAELHRVYPETASARIVDERHELREDCPLFPPGGFANRPTVRTPQEGLVLAGDLVRIDLPVALMERAATTGTHAANVLLELFGVRGHPLWTVPVAGRWAPLRALAARFSQ
ncbi:FAD-dependent oxidoreductase [Allokutzneria sp. NRRL B-24872]|uniref:FAD-dependent oxidoreductase n=1 Tax=Allokutzneria sp. NRRL B-24872 TaxID=1137961 RepID=UPI001FED5C9A|nr:FAD-dependent oxidoreductase [Allokutzneria sp. NRRL B-24872]